MARGFDSKSVTDQQEENQRVHDKPEVVTTTVSPRRRSLELARVDLKNRLESAPESRREELRATLLALDDLIEQA
jgi:hypothetical protein